VPQPQHTSPALGSPLTQETDLQNLPEGNHMSVGGRQPLALRCFAYSLALTGSLIQSSTWQDRDVARKQSAQGWLSDRAASQQPVGAIPVGPNLT